MSVITVTWMDGLQEIYHADRLSDDGSVLCIEKRTGTAGEKTEAYSIPLCNVRVWKAEGEGRWL